MFAKLVFKNIKRNAKDYAIYFITLIICTSMFYSFLSICSKYYQPTIGVQYNMDMLKNNMYIIVIVITSILLFLVKYVNNYMIRRKQKEFAIQTMLGMEQKTTALLFFLETISMGFGAIIIGIVVGSFISQIITAIVMSSFGKEYRIYFYVFSDTTIFTIFFFMIIFCLIGISNIKTIRKIKIIDMLNSYKKVDSNLKSDKTMGVLIFVGALLAIVTFLTGVNIYNSCYDSRLYFSTRITYYGNVIMPGLYLLSCILYMIIKIVKKLKPVFIYFVGIQTILAMGIALFEMRVISGDIVLQYDIQTMYLMWATLFLIIAIFGFFYCISDLILWIKHKYKNVKYRNGNLFLFGQLCVKLKITSKTMAIISTTLSASIIAMILAPLLSGWILGYLGVRSIYDIQISASYRNVISEQNLLKRDYAFVYEFLDESSIEVSNSVDVELYFLKKEDFFNRIKYDFPELAISVSDYNQMLEMIDKPSIKLSEKEFATQWYKDAYEEDIDDFISNNQNLNIGETKLNISKQGFLQENIGEDIYNAHTNMIYILPDNICKSLIVANCNAYINTTDKIPYNLAVQIEDYILDKTKYEDKITENKTSIKLNTLEVNEAVNGALLTRLLLLYLGIVLIIICFTVLSLQQLSDAYEFKYRFDVLKKIGTTKNEINTIIRKQMLFWFGIPIVVSIIVSGAVISYVVRTNLSQFIAYLGFKSMYVNIISISSIISIIFITYFISTWILFKKNID